MPSLCQVFTSVTVALLAVLFALLQSRQGEVPFNSLPYSLTLQPAALTPPLLHDGQHYTFGKFSSPVLHPNLRPLSAFESTFQRKEWAFTAVSDAVGKWLIGFAVADLGYAETGFLYFLDTKSGAHDSWQFLLPGFVNGAKVASSDVEDGTCSKFSTYFSALYIEICYRADMNGWRMDARAKTKINYKLALQVDMIRTGGDELALNYPIGPDRAGYTHKTAGLAVNGTLTFLPTGRAPAKHRRGVRQQVNAPFIGSGLSDYTRSQSRRFTEWFWIAFTMSTKRSNGDVSNMARHGLQFSTNTVGSLESVVWIDGKMYEVNSPLSISFFNTSSNTTTLLQPGQKELVADLDTKYVITSADGLVSLEYVPHGVLPTALKTPLVYGAFYHSYGVYKGSVAVSTNGPVLQLQHSVPGIFEDHSVHW